MCQVSLLAPDPAPMPMAQKRTLQEAARAAAIAAHAAAGLCTSAKEQQAARLLRVAEAMARSAVVTLASAPVVPDYKQEEKEMQPTSAAPSSATAPPSGRRRRRTRKKKVKHAKQMDVDDSGLSGQEVTLPTAQAILPTTINLFNIVDSGESAARDFVVSELRRRQWPADTLSSGADLVVALLLAKRKLVRKKDGYDGMQFREDFSKELDELVEKMLGT